MTDSSTFQSKVFLFLLAECFSENLAQELLEEEDKTGTLSTYRGQLGTWHWDGKGGIVNPCLAGRKERGPCSHGSDGNLGQLRRSRSAQKSGHHAAQLEGRSLADSPPRSTTPAPQKESSASTPDKDGIRTRPPSTALSGPTSLLRGPLEETSVCTLPQQRVPGGLSGWFADRWAWGGSRVGSSPCSGFNHASRASPTSPPPVTGPTPAHALPCRSLRAS